MKAVVRMSALLLGVVLLSSCYVMTTQPTGSIKLSFADGSPRAISPTATVRVYLYTYSSPSSHSLYTFPGGSTHKDFQYGSGTATLSGIPAGLWQVLITIGTDTNGLFEAGHYGSSDVISVIGGVNTPATITAKASPFAYSASLAGKSINSVAMDYYNYTLNAGGDSLYVSTPNSLYSFSPPPQAAYPVPDLTAAPSEITLPSGLQIASLSLGIYSDTLGQQGTLSYCLFINSNQGIVPFLFSVTSGLPAFDTTVFSSSLVDTSGNRYSVLASQALVDSSNALTVYYARSGGLGGAYMDGKLNTAPYDPKTQTGAKWVDIDTTAQVSGNPVYAIAPDIASANSGYTYFATRFGAFRTGAGLVTYGGQLAGDLTSVVYFSGPNGARIQAVAVDDFDGLIYIGTPQGAYYAPLNETSATSAVGGNWVPITATSGDNIVGIKVDVSSAFYGAPVTVALRSPSNLYTLTAPPTQGGVAASYPFYSGLPGTTSSMDFSHGTLYVGGSSGLVSILVDPAVGG